jgi:hypothetical protein
VAGEFYPCNKSIYLPAMDRRFNWKEILKLYGPGNGKKRIMDIGIVY